MPPATIVLLADDLTGACDVGIRATKAGHAVNCVFYHGGSAPELRAGVSVLDLETRRLGAKAAADRARLTGKRLRAAGIRPAYFKIDSTLRGHPVAEAEAVRSATGAPLVWFVPANPEMGRTTIGARHYVGGKPLMETPYARDPVNPVSTGNLLELAGRDIGRRACVRLPLRDLRRGPAQVGSLRREWLRSGVRLVAPDVSTDRDLARLAASIPGSDLPVGSAALAGHLLRRRGPAPGRRLGRAWRLKRARGLSIIGSLNPVTAAQVALAGRVPGVVVRWLSPADLRRADVEVPGTAVRWLVLALDQPAFRRVLTSKPAARAKESISRQLGSIAARLIRRWTPGVLLMSGGLTAAAVCEAVGIRVLALRREVTAGLVESEARGPAGPVTVLTKPGGFGSRRAVADIMRERGT